MKRRLTVGAVALTLAAPAAHSADLLEIYARARSADPQIAAARAGHEAALEVRPQALAAFKPKLSLSAAKSHSESEINDSLDPSQIGTTQKSDATSYSLNLTQPIYHHDYFLQLKQADSRVTQADAQLAAEQQGLIVRVAEVYFGRLAAEDALRFAEAEKSAIEQQLRQTKQRFEVGLTAITDVREAQARYDLAVSQAIAARNQLDVAKERLVEITGEAYASLSPLGEVPLLTPQPADLDQWVKTSLEQNLQLLATQAGSEIARNEAGRRRAAGLPALDLAASYGHSELPVFGRDTDDKTVSVQLTWPLYQGGFISSRGREAERLYSQSLALLEQQRRATVRQTRDAYLGVGTGISQVEALKQALESARTALEATEVGYQVGTRTAVDVLDAQTQLFRAQRDYSGSRYNYVLSTLRLKQAAGNLSEEDLRAVNAWLSR